MQTNNVINRISNLSIGNLFTAGVHYGHRVGARNPKMKQNIYSQVSGTHVIDIRRSYVSITHALMKLYSDAKAKKRVMFVSTNPRFESLVKEVTEKTGQHYVHKWRGGMLTNWRPVVSSIKALKRYNDMIAKWESENDSEFGLTKKEKLQIRRERDKLHNSFGGMINIGGIPDILVVFSVKNEKLAIAEANSVGIPVIGIVDTNADPDGVRYPIPGNDDSIRAASYYAGLFADAILLGMTDDAQKSKVPLNSVTALPTDSVGHYDDQASKDIPNV